MDKRDYYRIEDVIDVSYQTVTRTQMNSVPPEENFMLSGAFLASREIYALELEASGILRSVNEGDRQLGSFLHNLNGRVSLLTRSLISDELKDEDTNHDGTDISEGGIGFASNRFLTPGTGLALKMLFSASHLGLICYAQVRHCRLTEDGEAYRVGAQFIDLDNTTERLITRHIVKQQAEERRRRLHRSCDETLDMTRRHRT